MDTTTLEGWWQQFWSSLTEDPELWAAIGAGVLVLLIGAVAWWLRRRRRRAADAPVTENRATTLVRRPIYVDPIGLADLLAVAESRDLSRSLREDLEPTGLDATNLRTRETRELNKILASFDAHPHLAADLDRDGAAALTPGRAIRVTGRLHRLPASDLAELLELAAPLLIHAGDGGRQTATTTAASIDLSRPVATDAPLVAELTPHGSDQRLLVVFDPDGWRDGGHTELPETATLVGVIDQRLDNGRSLTPADYLTAHLSTDARRAVADRDLHDVVRPLSDLTEVRLRKRDLAFKGPGALVTPVALYH